MLQLKQNKHGFTIVELLVVIVVIGILAAITIVSYTGISQRATIASLQSDLSNASQKLKMYQVDNGAYPTQFVNDGTGNYCPSPVDVKYCFKISYGNSFPSYAAKNNTNPQTYILNATNGTTNYNITNDTGPASGLLSIHLFFDDFNRSNGALASSNWNTYYYVPQSYESRDPMTFNISSNTVAIGNSNSPYTGSAIYTAQSATDVMASLKIINYYTDYGPMGSVYLYARASLANQMAVSGYASYPAQGYGVFARNGGYGSKIVRFDNTTYTTISSTGPDVNPGDTIALKVVGSNITFLVNGAVKLTVTDSTYPSAGYVGFGACGNGFRYMGYVDDFTMDAQ